MLATNALRMLSLLFLTAILSAGCSGVKTYSSTLPKNMTASATLDSGSAFKSTIAEFDIHRVTPSCDIDYLGRVYLDDGESTPVGIPTGEPLFLDFIFASKVFLSSNISAVRYETMLTPRSGYDYQVDVRYVKGIFNVIIRETGKNGSTVRTLERRPLSSCKPTAPKGNTAKR